MNTSRLPLLAGLTLLASVSCGAPSMPPGTPGGGTVIFPPAAGTAVFSAHPAGGTDVVQAAVAATGLYGLTLPPDPTLPDTAPTLLDLLGPALPAGTIAACQDALTTDPPAARLLVLSGGRYLIGTQVTGRLRPSPQAIGTQQIQVTVRQFVYSDRAATLGSDQTCTFTLDGQILSGTLRVRSSLRSGWNVLETQLKFGPDRLTVDVTDAATDAAVNWQYLPLSYRLPAVSLTTRDFTGWPTPRPEPA